MDSDFNLESRRASNELTTFDTERFVRSLVRGRQNEAEEMLETWIARGSSYTDIAVHAVQKALYEVGNLWEQGRISVAQEHLASAICQSMLVRAFDAADFGEPREEKVLFACVENNLHAMGLQIVSDTFEIDGWKVEFLGANVPTATIVRDVLAWRPDLVGLSVSLPEQLETVNDVVAQIRAALGEAAPKFVIGGRPIRDHVDAVTQLGVVPWSADADTVRALQ